MLIFLWWKKKSQRKWIKYLELIFCDTDVFKTDHFYFLKNFI